MKKALETSEKFFQNICGAMMVVMTIAMFWQILARFIFEISNTWTEETARFLCIWCVYIGTSVCCLRDSHIRVTIIDGYLKGVASKVVVIIRNVIQMAFFAYIAKIGLDTLKVVALQTSPNMLIPMNIVYSMIPIGCALSVIYLIIGCIITAKEKTNG